MATKKRVPKGLSFPDRLLWEKDQRGSYQKLADDTGFSVSQLHDWATGKYEPTLSSLRDLAKALDCELTDLVAA